MPEGYDDARRGARRRTFRAGKNSASPSPARSLTRPEILILDDSTSAVDVETETLIQDALESWMRGRTSFVVAQRISTVLRADKIVVLEGGRIAAQGTHRELLQSSPIYREIFDSQLGGGLPPDEEGHAPRGRGTHERLLFRIHARHRRDPRHDAAARRAAQHRPDRKGARSAQRAAAVCCRTSAATRLLADWRSSSS